MVIKGLEAKFLNNKPPKGNDDDPKYNGRVKGVENVESDRADTPASTRFQGENPV
ncbi:hypothetical protein [Myxosarcina sp. GI1]|uniref:hypothetical protein n=1 Tax=Myxosarcina sp. GI1 TaxID=1541065 RepID=UPI001C109870|nr:hypothetical protein [Myxosarcina sp. GI1]